MTEQHISAQVWTCTRCGSEDAKSCSCAAATATSREIRAAKKEAHRQAVNRSAAKKREKKQHSADNPRPVEKIGESLGLNAIGKPRSESFDPKYRLKHRPPSIERLYAPMKPAAPPSAFTSQTSALKSAWVKASPEAKRHFLVEYWDEISREKSAADDEYTEHTTEDAPSLAL